MLPAHPPQSGKLGLGVAVGDGVAGGLGVLTGVLGVSRGVGVGSVGADVGDRDA